MLPSEIYTKALYYRADLLSEEESIPRYFYTVESTGKEKMNSTEVDYGFVMPLGQADRYQMADYFIWSSIGLDNIANIGAAYYVKDESSKTIFSLPEAETALNKLKSFYNELGPEAALSMDDQDVVELFMNRRAFMVMADSKALKASEGILEDEDWVVYPAPLSDPKPSDDTETQSGSELGIFSSHYDGWSISSDSDCEEVAAAFLLYLSNADNNTYLSGITGGIPIHSDAIELDDYFSDSHFSGYQLLADRAAIGLYHYVQPPKAYDAFIPYEKMVNERYEAFFKGELDAKALLSELDAYWVKAYETEGQLWETAPAPIESPNP